MDHKLNMKLLKNLTLLHPNPLRFNMMMGFSTSNSKVSLSLEAQKAVWATAIIRMILKQSLPTSIYEPSLFDRIVSLQNPSDKFQFDPSSKAAVMELFVEGIRLQRPFIVQDRISHALQESRTAATFGVIEMQQSDASQNESQKVFRFYPNSRVTPLVFRQLMRYNQQVPRNLLLNGGSGIGKTASIILFIQLTYFQTKYIYKALKDDEKIKELEELIKLQLLFKKTPKYWYWSADIPKENQDNFYELLLAQAVELDRSSIQQLLKYKYSHQITRKLIKLYHRQYFESKPIIEQINVIASIMRQCNQDIMNNNYTPSLQKTKLIANCSQIKQNFRCYLDLGYNYLLSSSVPIQAGLFERRKDQIHTFGLVNSHHSFDTVNIAYEIIFATKVGQIDFWQIFWLEVERRMKLDNLDETTCEDIKLKFYKIVEQINVSTFCRFYYARTYLKKHYTNFIESLITSKKEKTLKHIAQFQQHCLDESKKILLNFLRKGEIRLNSIFLSNLIVFASYRNNNPNKRNYPMEISIQLVEKYMGLYFSVRTSKLVQLGNYISESNYLKSIITCWQPTTQMVHFPWTPAQFVELITPPSPPLQDPIHFHTQLSSNLRMYSQYPPSRGVFIENYLLSCLRQKGTLAYKATHKQSPFLINAVFFIHEEVPFSPVNKKFEDKASGKTIQTNFAQVLQMAKLHPLKDILATPYFMKDEIRVKYSYNDQAIDFLIVHYNQVADQYIIHSFDVTISKYLSRKVRDVKVLYAELLKQNKLESRIAIKHVILTPTYSVIPLEQRFMTEEQKLKRALQEKIKESVESNEANKEEVSKKAIQTQLMEDSLLEIHYATLENLHLESKDKDSLQLFSQHLIINQLERQFNDLHSK